MGETATWCCTRIKYQTSSNTYSTCGRLVSSLLHLYTFILFEHSLFTLCYHSKNWWIVHWRDFMSDTRDVMPLKMRSQLVPTKLSTLITNTMEPRSRSGWSWERSLAISWQFLKANSSSLRFDFSLIILYFITNVEMQKKILVVWAAVVEGWRNYCCSVGIKFSWGKFQEKLVQENNIKTSILHVQNNEQLPPIHQAIW